MRAVPALACVALCLATSSIEAKPRRHDAGTFLIRAPHSLAKVRKDHPSYAKARAALWECWTASRPCAVTLKIETGDDQTWRQDAFVEIAKDGSRSVVLREERWSRSSSVGLRYPESATIERSRRFSRLERFPLEEPWNQAAALADTDDSGAERWRLRFLGGEVLSDGGMRGELRRLGDEGTALW